MDDNQAQYLEDAINVVKQEAFQMQKALDASNLRDALKHSSNMISELKTSLLSPRNYYELYMQVFDQLRYMESYFMEEYRRGRKVGEMYEKVQHASSIVPRLYLLITVGSVYIQTKELPAKDVIKDLIEMVKGVQHPIRGLFLRYYLNKVCKDKLPDKDNEYEGEGGDVTDSADFILTNLAEMNRLWVRMQHTGTVSDKNKREKERNDLRVTVGENIVRLSNLEGINLELYRTIVLPKILEVITASKDTISQQYLMDCIIQAFPDEYHLNTLEPLLDTCAQLQPTVDIKLIFINLMDRLSNYAGESELEIVNQIDIFGLFKRYIDKILEEQSGNIETKKLLELEVAFLRFSLKCYPLNTENVNAILESCVQLIERSGGSSLDNDSLRSIVKLLSFPLETLSLAILNMNYYPHLMRYLQYNSRKQVANKIVQAVVASKKPLSSDVTAGQLLEFVKPLLVDSPDASEPEPFEIEDEMKKVASLVHLVKTENPEEYFRILNMFRDKFEEGGLTRYKYTYPALVFAYFRYVEIVEGQGHTVDYESLLKSLSKIMEQLAENHPELTLNLNLQVVLLLNARNDKSLSEAAYEFASQALMIYQDDIVESAARSNALNLISGVLIRSVVFQFDEYMGLVAFTARFAARQLRKSDQCYSVTACTHLFWDGNFREENRVFECLKKAQYISEICMLNPKNLILQIIVLNKKLNFMLQSVSGIESDDINESLVNINNQLTDIEQDKENAIDTTEMRVYLRNTIHHIKSRQSKGKFTGVRVQQSQQ